MAKEDNASNSPVIVERNFCRNATRSGRVEALKNAMRSAAHNGRQDA